MARWIEFVAPEMKHLARGRTRKVMELMPRSVTREAIVNWRRDDANVPADIARACADEAEKIAGEALAIAQEMRALEVRNAAKVRKRSVKHFGMGRRREEE